MDNNGMYIACARENRLIVCVTACLTVCVCTLRICFLQIPHVLCAVSTFLLILIWLNGSH